MKKLVSGILMALLALGMITLVFNVQPVEATGTIHIRADGSIDPPTTLIYTADNTTYTLTGNIAALGTDGVVVVERDNITLDGAGYMVYTFSYNSRGICLDGVNNVTIENTTIEAYYGRGVYLNGVNNVTIKDTITEAGYGIWLNSSSNNSISRNNMTDGGGADSAGIVLYSSSSNSISGNNVTGGSQTQGIVIESSSDHNCISGNTFIDGGLSVWNSYQNSVENNTVDGKPLVYLEGVSDHIVDDAGQVVLVSCENITVEDLNLGLPMDLVFGSPYTESSGYGIQLWKTTNSTISGNNITNSYEGILLDSSSNYDSIFGNNITDNYDGVWLNSSSNYDSIFGNNITDNANANIFIGSSWNNNISENNVTGNSEWGIHLDSSWNNSISGNNINGIWLDNSSSNNVYGDSITNGGIVLFFSWSNSISGSNITKGGWGINLLHSWSNSISGNNITANDMAGIGLWDYSNYNSISGNNVTNNGFGIWLWSSSNCSIFHNHFVNNNIQVNSSDSVNIWDNGYPFGGNYWSDYNGTDLYNGPYQNLTGSDGIGDTPYVIDAHNLDNYPLMSTPYVMPHTVGDLNGDGKVGLDDLVLLANAYNSKPGDPNWNPLADIAPPYGIIGLTDLVTVAMHYGQHNP